MRKIFLHSTLVLLLLTSVNAYSSKLPSSEPASTVVEKPNNSSIKDALSDFSKLSRHEKKSRIKEMKRVIKEYKADKKAGKDVDTNVILQVILALFIPPLAVYLHEGSTNNRFWISVLLTILGLLIFGFAGVLFLGSLPSIVYALIVILGS